MTNLPAPDDATLARAAASGDGAALGVIYDRYAGRLLGFCHSMLRNRSDAEDCLQDVFVIAAAKLADLREPSLLRSWLFAVARHECLARLDKRKKEVLVDDVADQPTTEADSPENAALHRELATLLHDAGQGLSDRDRLMLELADRQGLSGDEFANAIGVPRSTAYTLLARARTTARKSIGALLVARTGRERCPDLDAVLTGWDGALSTLKRKQLVRHIESCEVCSEQRDRVATPLALLGEGRAFAAETVGLRSKILAAAAAGGPPVRGKWVDGWPPSDLALRRRRWVPAVAALLVLLLLGGSTAAVLANSHGNDVVPVAAPTTTHPAASTAATSSTVPIPTVTVTQTVVVPPVTSAHPTTPVPTPLTSTPPTLWALSVYSDQDADSVTIKGTPANPCPGGGAKTPCGYQVPYGQVVSVHTPSDNEFFSAPAGCTSVLAGPNGATCTFTMTADTTVRLTEPVIQ